MNRLYLTSAPDNKIMAIKVLREALRTVDPEATAKQADTLLDRLAHDGYALIAEGDPVDLARMTDLLVAGECLAILDLPGGEQDRLRRQARNRRIAAEAREANASPEDVFAAHGTDKPDAPFVPSDEAVAVALVTLAQTEGNPARAALHAHALGRATGDLRTYAGAIMVLFERFPWCEEPVKAAIQASS